MPGRILLRRIVIEFELTLRRGRLGGDVFMDGKLRLAANAGVGRVGQCRGLLLAALRPRPGFFSRFRRGLWFSRLRIADR